MAKQSYFSGFMVIDRIPQFLGSAITYGLDDLHGDFSHGRILSEFAEIGDGTGFEIDICQGKLWAG